MSETTPAQQYAAIDLGSNSFHMIIAEPEGDSIRVIDSLRIPVRLGSGLDKEKRIKPSTEKVALQTIGQFAQRLRDIPVQNIRIVGTNTLRRANNADRFIEACYQLLNKRIEIISGREEARLIYSAVAHGLPDPDRKRLVIDIGGGSTELIIGSGFKPSLMESVNMGCVSFTAEFIHGDKLTQENLNNCVIQAQLELQPVTAVYRASEWDEAIGCSGTIKATSRVLAELGLSDGTITRPALKLLQKKLIEKGSLEKLGLSSISKDRAHVFVAGVMILFATMKHLRIDSIRASQVALREGLIFGLIGKSETDDIQSQTIANLVSRYHIDPAHAERVEALAMTLFDQAAAPWGLKPESDRVLLSWASQLHEIGMSVAHTQYHKHGFYLIDNSDLLGFSKAEQNALALLVRYHRRKFDIGAFIDFPTDERDRMIKLQTLLRLSTLLLRARSTEDLHMLEFEFFEDEIALRAPAHWFTAHPLTTADLNQEAEHLDGAGFSLTLIRIQA